MKQFLILILITVISSCSLAQKEDSHQNNENNTFVDTDFKRKTIEIPYLKHTNLSADFEKIREIGLHVDLYSSIFGETRTKKDFSPEFKIAWNEDFLLIQYKVIDDINYIYPSNWRLWRGDALVLFLAKEIEESRNFIQEVYVSDPSKENNLRTYKYDFRKKNTYATESNIISTSYTKDTAVIIEIAIPFQNFDTKGKLGDEYGLQLIAYDYDKRNDQKHIAYPFSYIMGVSENPWATRKIKLVDKTTIKSDLITRSFWIDEDSIKFIFYADKKYNNKKISLRDQSVIYFEDTIRRDKNNSFTFSIPMPIIDENFKPTALFIDDKFINIIDLGILPIQHINTKPVRFENIIRVFEKQDRESSISDSLVLFLGSSSIRRWESLGSDFKKINTLNRAFGGSIAQDINIYMDRIVFPYKPAKIVYYEGDNDIFFKMTPEDFIDTCKVFITKVREVLPETEIILLSIKPSPSRKKLWRNMQIANSMLKQIADTTENVKYIDITTNMFDENGKIKTDIWEKDRLHMNEKGYEIWYEVLKEHLCN